MIVISNSNTLEYYRILQNLYKQSETYGKSPFLMGKSTISTAILMGKSPSSWRIPPQSPSTLLELVGGMAMWLPKLHFNIDCSHRICIYYSISIITTITITNYYHFCIFQSKLVTTWGKQTECAENWDPQGSSLQRLNGRANTLGWTWYWRPIQIYVYDYIYIYIIWYICIYIILHYIYNNIYMYIYKNKTYNVYNVYNI